jgi:hypothetical protein
MGLPKGATKRKVVGPPFWRVFCFPTFYVTSPRFNCIPEIALGFIEERVAESCLVLVFSRPSACLSGKWTRGICIQLAAPDAQSNAAKRRTK